MSQRRSSSGSSRGRRDWLRPRGQIAVVWTLVGTILMVALMVGFLSVRRLTLIQEGTSSLLETAAGPAAVSASCADLGGASLYIDPNAAVASFVATFHAETGLLPQQGYTAASGATTCDVSTPSSLVPTAAPEQYTLSYETSAAPGGSPYTGPLTITLTVVEPTQVGQTIPGADGITPTEPGILVQAAGQTEFALAGVGIEPWTLDTAWYQRVARTANSTS